MVISLNANYTKENRVFVSFSAESNSSSSIVQYIFRFFSLIVEVNNDIRIIIDDKEKNKVKESE